LIQKALTYSALKDSNPLFGINKNSKDEKYILVPSNFGKLLEHSVFAGLMRLIVELDIPFVKGDVEIQITPANEELRLFFAGFINRLLRPLPEETKSLNFTGKLSQERGRACADAEAFLHFAGIPSAYALLPDTVKFGLKKEKLLTARINALAGVNAVGILGQLPNRILEAVRVLIRRNKQWKTIVDDYRISFGQAIAGIARTHKKTDRKTKIVTEQPIHLVRPSQKAEVLFDYERSILKRFETPWDEIQELTKQCTKGVPLRDIETVRESYKKHYLKQFEINDKLNAFCAARRVMFRRVLTKIHGRKAPSFTPKLVPEIMERVIDDALDRQATREDVQDLDNLSLWHLEKIFNEAPEWTQYTRATEFRKSGTLNHLRKKKFNESFIQGYIGWLIGLNERAQIHSGYINKRRGEDLREADTENLDEASEGGT
jgi:hypothetical protein